METAARFCALARRDIPLGEYSWEFCGLAAVTAFDDATILSLFWHRANFHRPVDLPDTTGLRWREGILRCLESVLLLAKTSPSSSAALPSPPPFAVLSRPPPFVAHASPPPFAAHISPPPSAALPHLPPFTAPAIPPFVGKLTPPSAALPSPPAVSMASPPAVSMASLPVVAHTSPVPAPRQCPPEPAP